MDEGYVAGTWVEVPSGPLTSTLSEKLTEGLRGRCVCVPVSAVVLNGSSGAEPGPEAGVDGLVDWSNALPPEPENVVRGGKP